MGAIATEDNGRRQRAIALLPLLLLLPVAPAVSGGSRWESVEGAIAAPFHGSLATATTTR